MYRDEGGRHTYSRERDRSLQKKRELAQSAVLTHILGWLPENVTHAPSVPQAVIQDSDNAHEQRVAGTL